jgi:membrane protease YdiL (CAAX protease family)
LKKEYQHIGLVFFGFMGLLWLGKPLREYFDLYSDNNIQNQLLAGVIVRTVLLIILLVLVKRFNLLQFNGLNKPFSVQNPQALILSVGILSAGAFSNWDIYVHADTLLFVLFTLSALLVGLVEEISFRGILFPMLIRAHANSRYVLYTSAVLAALIFGIVHFINLFREPDNIWGVTRQVLFALCIGVFFSGLLLRTGNIIVTSLVHGFVNFALGPGELKKEIATQTVEQVEKSPDWSSIIPTTLMFLFVLAGGLFMIGRVNKEDVEAKLGHSSQAGLP